MDWGVIIAIALVVLTVGGAIAYLIYSKKSGKKCIGCPYCDSCKGDCSSFSAFATDEKEDFSDENEKKNDDKA